MVQEHKRLTTTLSVVDNMTGEVKPMSFTEEKTKKKVKGGWRMVYFPQGYDLVTLQLTSQRETYLMYYIRDLFTKSKSEVVLSPKLISKELNLDTKFISKTIKKLVGLDLIMQLTNKSYRLNPFMVLPYLSNADELQKEWIKIRERHGFIRRGTDVRDNYKEYGRDYDSFNDYINAVRRGRAKYNYGIVRRTLNPKTVNIFDT